MCGIVGYTGPREAGPILIEGLKRLEYRGYDSAGIALVDEDGDLFVEKKAGKLANLADGARRPHAPRRDRPRPHPLGDPRPPERPERPSAPGLHRRHHGHPQRDHRELPRAPRRPRGARPHAHLRDRHRGDRPPRRGGATQGDLADAVRATLRQLEGAYALVVMHKREIRPARRRAPERAARRRPARRGELHRERRRRDPRPHEPDRLPRGGRRRRRPADRRRDHRRRRRGRASGRDRRRLDARGRREGRLRPLHAQGDPRAARGAPPVHRRPRDAATAGSGSRRSPASRSSSGACDADRARRLRHRLLRGARRARPRSRSGPGCRPARPSARSSATARRRSTAKTLVIAVTQSGETADTIAPTRHAREQGCPIVAVTNTVGSAITREADAVVFLQAGPGDRGRRLEDVHDPGHDARRSSRRRSPGPAGTTGRSSRSCELGATRSTRCPAAAQRALERVAPARRDSPAAT